MEKMPNKEPENRSERRARKRGDTDEFWDDIGVDIEGMSPKAQAVTGVVAGGLVLLAAATVLIAVPQMWWLIFVFGWAVFPAFSVFARGIAGLVDSREEALPEGTQEKELLGALRRHGELSSTQVAMETSLTVSQADEMLQSLAAKGHLDVRVRGGGIFYGLWEQVESGDPKGSEGG